MKSQRLIVTILVLITLAGLAQATPGNYTIHPVENVLYLPMNGSVGCSTFFDYSAYQHAMASYGSVQTPAMNATNVFGSASGYFPGPGYSAYIRPGAPSSDYNITTDFTFSFWMKSPSLPDNTRIYHAGATGTNFEIEVVNHRLSVYTNGIGSHTQLSATTIDDNNWHYITVRRSASTGNLIQGYVDGTLGALAAPASSEIIGSNTEAPYIGAYFTGGNAYRGLLDDFTMYNGLALDGTVVPVHEFIGNPTSGFAANVTSGAPPLLVGFGNRTFGNLAQTYIWNATAEGNTTPFTIVSGTTANAPNFTFINDGNYLVNLSVINKFGNSSSFSWINVTSPTPGIASFTMANTTPVISSSSTAISGYAPTTVTFTNTSYGFNGTPTFSWSYTPISTGIPVVFSTAANPTYTFSNVGNYSISLMESNPYFTNTTTQTAWVNLSAQPQIVADFTANVTSQTYPPGAVLFTDASYGFTPNTWLWTFGDGGTSTSENPAHTYTTAGLYTVSLTASRSDNLTNTDTKTKTDYINITYSPFYVNADFVGMPTSGSPGLLVSFTDLSIVGNATASITCNWSFGDSFSATPFSSSCGNVQHVYTYAGVYDVNLSVTMLGNTSYKNKPMYITISTTQQNTNTVYTQHFISYRVVDLYKRPLSPVTVTAFYVNSSLPAGSSITYLTEAFGIDATVASSMLNSSAALQGVTGTDGKIGFVMFPAIQYTVQAVNSTMGVACQMTAYPTESDYLMYCPLQSQSVVQNNTATQIAGSYVWITEPNNSFVTFNAQYQDPLGITSDLWFNVTCPDNQTVMFQDHPGNPGTSLYRKNFTLPNVRGTQINAYLKYNRSA